MLADWLIHCYMFTFTHPCKKQWVTYLKKNKKKNNKNIKYYIISQLQPLISIVYESWDGLQQSAVMLAESFK